MPIKPLNYYQNLSEFLKELSDQKMSDKFDNCQFYQAFIKHQ